MHDITELEKRGTPGVFVASTEFIEAAKIQAEALGFKPASVFIQHPIQDRTESEVKVLADKALESLLKELTG